MDQASSHVYRVISIWGSKYVTTGPARWMRTLWYLWYNNYILDKKIHAPEIRLFLGRFPKLQVPTLGLLVDGFSASGESYSQATPVELASKNRVVFWCVAVQPPCFYIHSYIYTLEVQDQTKNGLLDDPCKGFPTTNGQSLVFGLPGYIYIYPRWCRVSATNNIISTTDFNFGGIYKLVGDFSPTPLKNISISQIGSWNPRDRGEKKHIWVATT